MMLYKYRDFTNLQFALDIFVNHRMFAAPFEMLNDPMEGAYRYKPGLLAPNQIEAIYSEKNRWHLLSLSQTPNNMLMWSHYSAGHSGIVIGLEITDPDAEVKPVRYVSDLTIEQNGPDLPKLLLSRKFDSWTYEREYRVFKRKRNGRNAKTFVKIKPRELIFGLKTDRAMEELVSAIGHKFCPCITTRKITKDELEAGNYFPMNARHSR